MERLTGMWLAGAVLALGGAALPAAAQDDTSQTTTKTKTTTTTVQKNPVTQTTTVTQTTAVTTQNDMKWDPTIPSSPGRSRLMLLQTMSDKGFTKADLIKCVPLLEDLRDAENAYEYRLDITASEWSRMPDQSKINGSESARAAARDYRTKREAIWNTINTSIGADKCVALRSLVEPVRIDLSADPYTSEHLMRIDQLLMEWDRESAARIAANGGAATNTTNTVSVETASTTTTTTALALPGIEVYSYPALTTSDMVDTMEMRLAGLESRGETGDVLTIQGTELTSPNLSWLRERRLRYWD